ncbi:hypothetical protein BT63DRAFT_423237 [Microthyrium microscopicum]|uniref:Protein transport protein SEC24 n=1 Tax=Microthyrium microscopicum TaxID=703497 RepID=A0A6A6UHR7_9PEZI|nr:hypothetical protein BT63DRAFT_423237 [Microthyrium microscopicum]
MDAQNAAGGPKKKRAYAQQAYDFGQNSGLQQQQQAQPPPPMMGNPQGLATPVSQVGAPVMPGAPGIAPAPQEQLASQFGQMNIQGAPQQPTAQMPPQASNQLYPSDLIGQPFTVQELDNPPPPIHLPPNTSVTPSPYANGDPKYIRSTLNCVPTTHSLLKKSKLPFALILTPYTSLHDAEDPVPVCTDQVISRCRRCRSYINTFVTFLDHGHRWRCNMCNLANDVPQAFDWDAAAQQSVDRWQRPELNYSVIEFIAPQEYMVRPPQALTYVFLLDVSFNAVTSGLLATVARSILESLDRIPNADGRTKLAFLAVDSSLHYFSIPQDGGEGSEPTDPKMLVVSDLDEPFLPTPEDLVVNLIACRQNIESFLGKLQSMFKDTQNTGCAMGSALRAGLRLVSSTGGKLSVLSATLPNMGHGKLEMREDKKALGTSKEAALLQTGNAFYKSFAVECSKQQVSIDMFLFSAQYQDVASLSNLPRYTGGQTFFYPGWSAAKSEDAIKFATEFGSYLSAEIGLEAVLRVRASTGLRMNAFYGNFFNRSSDLCAFPAFPRDQGYVVEVAIDENLSKPYVSLQAAILHTTCNGERRVRVMTLALPTTESLANVYSSADQQSITAYFAHKAVERALGSGLEAARDALQSKVIEIMQTYRKELAGGNMGGGGLQLPANLRALPILFLGLMKHLGLRKSAQIPTDLRSAALCLLSTIPLPLLMQYIYPRVYSLHDMPDSAGVPDPETNEVVLPPAQNLSSERIVPFGLYLIDDGQTQFLWLGRDAVPALIADVFGVEDKMAVNQGKTLMPELDNDFSERVRAVIEKSRDHRAKGVGSITVPPLYVVREDGEPSLKLWAQTLLVEDRSDGGASAPQWLGMLREKVVQ